MLYHGEQPSSQTYEPFYYGLLTTMARIEGKLKRHKPLAVTFIGGSVTAAYCKEPGIGCWVSPVSDWLVEQDPQVSLVCPQQYFSHDLAHSLKETLPHGSYPNSPNKSAYSRKLGFWCNLKPKVMQELTSGVVRTLAGKMLLYVA